MSGWRLAIELAGLVSLVIAAYTLCPVLSVTSLEPSDLHGNNGVKASIVVNGTQIRDVKVQCMTNKVIFADRDTLALSRFTLLDEYSVNDVGRGESFTADCGFTWSMWTKPMGEGLFIMGAGTPGKPQLGIPFTFKDGLPSLTPGVPLPASITTDFMGYSSSEVTAIDGSFVVLYKWPWRWFQTSKVIHIIGRRSDGRIKWRVAPNSEPIIPDAAGGFMVTASGPPKQWGVTMKRVTPP